MLLFFRQREDKLEKVPQYEMVENHQKDKQKLKPKITVLHKDPGTQTIAVKEIPSIYDDSDDRSENVKDTNIKHSFVNTLYERGKLIINRCFIAEHNYHYIIL